MEEKSLNAHKLPVISIMRLRMLTDGEGVTSLVGAYGCPLKCEYCINKDVLKGASFNCDEEEPNTRKFNRYMDAKSLVDELKIDDLYFKATNGGVVFGGGESLLHSDFLLEYKRVAPKEWKLILETSLNVPEEMLIKVLDIIDYYIVDIKDMNPIIYKKYTGKDNSLVISNLKRLAEKKDIGVCVRIPLIPNYNTDEDRDKSEAIIREISDSFKIDRFNYIIR